MTNDQLLMILWAIFLARGMNPTLALLVAVAIPAASLIYRWIA